jgi:predicted  nucleic acid-binding Zn-ribbon protein
MTFSTNVLMTAQECEALIAENSSQKNTLLIRRTKVANAIATNTSMVTLIPAELAAITAKITQAQGQLTNATDVLEQRNLSIEINSLENQQMRLMTQAESMTGPDLLEKQLVLSKIDKEVEALQEYDVALTARKTELTAAAA